MGKQAYTYHGWLKNIATKEQQEVGVSLLKRNRELSQVGWDDFCPIDFPTAKAMVQSNKFPKGILMYLNEYNDWTKKNGFGGIHFWGKSELEKS